MEEDTEIEALAAAARRQPVEPMQEPEEDEYEEPEEENVGQWSPRALEPEHVVGQDVIPEEEDARLLDLLRKKVGLCAARSPIVEDQSGTFLALFGCLLCLLLLWIFWLRNYGGSALNACWPPGDFLCNRSKLEVFSACSIKRYPLREKSEACNMHGVLSETQTERH